MHKITHEDLLALLEAQDIKLYNYQKEMLKLFSDNEDSYFIPYSHCGRRFNFMNKENEEETDENN